MSKFGMTILLAGLVLAGCAEKQGKVCKPVEDKTAPVMAGVPTTQPIPAEWYPKAKERDWKVIVIHHSASDFGGAKRFDEWHRARGWLCLGYDFVIGNGTDTPDGCIEVGPRWINQMQGAHAGDAFFNQYGIGINLVGNFEYSTPTPKQLDSLCRLMDFLMTRYHITSVKIYGHREVPRATTLCPGHYFPMDSLRYWYANYEPICASSVDVK